jgi:hypothetical protein
MHFCSVELTETKKFLFVRTKMKNASKLSDESKVMELLHMQLDDFPVCRIISSESPDYILQTSRHFRIGVEITRISSHRTFGIPSENSTYRFTINDIQEAIDRKADKSRLYQKKRLNELWLILVVGLDNACQGTLPANLSKKQFSPHGFRRILLADMERNKLTEIIS